MTIRNLNIFITVYQMENITKAARSLHITQPTVTRAIQELEDHYKRRLFERIHRRLYVTEAGKQLYKHAIHVTASINQMEKAMSEMDEAGSIRIGAGTTLGCVLLPSVLTEFQAKHPRLSIHSIVADTTSLQTMLLHNEIDFALIENAPDDPSLGRQFIGRDRMVLILPASHPLCDRKEITIQDLASQPIIVSETGSASRSFLEHIFSIHGMKLTPIMESGSMPVIIQAVQAKLGIALMPQRMVSLYSMAHAIVERELSYEVLTRENYLIWHESPYVSPTFQEFIETVKSSASQILS
ncbi:MAG: LysR family transcriptional regulator [Lachnospiraceae bacterium]|nr:LysR family transcriptional regulator [Lachnospiraceae bacterium]